MIKYLLCVRHLLNLPPFLKNVPGCPVLFKENGNKLERSIKDLLNYCLTLLKKIMGPFTLFFLKKKQKTLAYVDML